MLTVGEILKNERIKQGIELAAVEKQIKIRIKFLQAIEDNNWNVFSSRIYVAGVINNYSNFLGLDSKRILAFFRRDYEKKEEIKFKEKVSSKYLSSETKKIAIFGLSLIFLLFFMYFGYQLKQYLSPPKVIIIAPTTDQFTKIEKVKIIGKTEKDVMINIFGDRIYLNKEGIFEYDFPLKKGKNELIIEVTGANGKKTTIIKTYFLTL